MRAGSTPTETWPSSAACGVTPWRAAACSASTTIAAAPSVMAEALPAVMVPSFLNTGLSFAISSSVASARRCSSRSTVAARLPSPTVTGTTSRAKRPSLQARAARRLLSSAYASCSAREIPYSVASVSLVSPMSWLQSGQR